MIRRLHLLALRVFRRLPVRGRRWVVRRIAPTFSVGAICVIERSDGAVLLVRQTYRRGWGIPGGLLERRETPEDAARREVFEETGLDVELVGEPAVVVDEEARRVDVVFRARPCAEDRTDHLIPRSPEIREVAWFPVDGLPALQFETSGALVALARSARSPQAVPLPPDLSVLERRQAGA